MSTTIDTRNEQMFPKLTPHEIDRLRRFGEVRRYAAGEALFVTGDLSPGMYVLRAREEAFRDRPNTWKSIRYRG
jgi:hypothetical protein